MLDEAFEGIVKALLESRGGAVPSPVGLHKAQDALRLLVEDGYTEEQILTVLRWIWSEDHKDARFWRKQVASIAGLRKDPESKFAKVFLAWKGAKAAAAPRNGGALVGPLKPGMNIKDIQQRQE